MKNKKILIFISSCIIVSLFISTIKLNYIFAQNFEYPTEILSSDYYNQEVNYSLWDKFIKYDLCITDYDALTDKEKELCKFIFETERSANGTVRCERARRTLLSDDDLGDRINLKELNEISGIYDKYLSEDVHNYTYYKYNYYYYKHCVPDIKHIDGNINIDEYWLNEAGTQRILYHGYTGGFSYYENYGYCELDEMTQNWNFKEIKCNSIIEGPILIEKNNLVYTILPNNTITIVNNTLRNTKEPIKEPLIIPSKIDGYTVKGIETGAFASTPITKIILPDTINYIAPFSFSCCEYLENINIPEELEFMGEYVFEQCKSLKYININCPNLKISGYSFRGSGLENIDICAKIIDEMSFSFCDYLENIKILNGTRKILSKAFYKCPNLKNVELPATLEVIGENAFSETAIKSINIPSTVKVIDALQRASGIIQYSSIGDIPATDPLTKEQLCMFDDDCTIYGYKNTEAEFYAKKNNLTFINLDIHGDANCDGEITVADVLSVSMYIGNPEENLLSEQEIINADVHNSGNGLNATDAFMIQQYIAGFIKNI